MELSLYDAQNSIRDWMEHDRSNSDSLLDEDTQSDTPIPSRMVTEGDNSRTLRRIMGKSCIIDWADETVDDTHIGKQKQKIMTKKGKGKKQRECLEAMRRLLVRDRAQNTKNSMIALLPPILMMGHGGSQYHIEPVGDGTQFTCEKHKLTMLHMCTLFFHT
jgi:hypothetical protein